MNQVSACMGASKTNSGGNGATEKNSRGFTLSMTTGGSIPGK
jgi:hypothetical protein